MREIEIAQRHHKYKEKKPLSKQVLMTGYIAVGALFLLTILTRIKILLFLFVAGISTIINYQTNLPTIRFNPDPEVFSSLLITRLLGLKWALLMLLIPTVFVDTYTARMDKDTFISLIVLIIINIVMNFLPGMNFVVLGLILVTIKFAVGLALNALLDISPQEILFEHVLGFISNLLIFLSLGTFFINLFT